MKLNPNYLPTLLLLFAKGTEACVASTRELGLWTIWTRAEQRGLLLTLEKVPIEQYSIGTGPSSHNVPAKHDAVKIISFCNSSIYSLHNHI